MTRQRRREEHSACGCCCCCWDGTECSSPGSVGGVGQLLAFLLLNFLFLPLSSSFSSSLSSSFFLFFLSLFLFLFFSLFLFLPSLAHRPTLPPPLPPPLHQLNTFPPYPSNFCLKPLQILSFVWQRHLVEEKTQLLMNNMAAGSSSSKQLNSALPTPFAQQSKECPSDPSVPSFWIGLIGGKEHLARRERQRGRDIAAEKERLGHFLEFPDYIN